MNAKVSRMFVIARVALVTLVILQLFLSVLFLTDFLVDFLGIRTKPVSWGYREMMEISAVLALSAGLSIGISMLVLIRRQMRAVENQMLLAANAFQDVMQRYFDDWTLSPSERDVALFTLKGFSNEEIAQLRGTSVGTIKSQCNSVFRKAGVSGRMQLINVFIEHLVGDADTTMKH